MRIALTVAVAGFVAGCASAPAGEKIAVFDHKNNVTRYAYQASQSEFVGTSAKASSTQQAKPSWYAFGHP